MMNPSKVTLAVLAGGEGSRMGRPKGELVVGDQPILAYLLDRIAWSGRTLLVTAPGRERPPAWQRFDREVSDPVAGEGPLRGVLTAIEASETDEVVIATVDMPEVRAAQLTWLVAELHARANAVGVVCARSDGKIEPFPAAIRRSAAEMIRARLAEGERSMHSLVKVGGFVAAPCPEPWPDSVWANLNRPEDLKLWLDPENGRAG